MTDPKQLWGDDAFTHRLAELVWTRPLAVLLHLNERSTGHPARDWLTAWAPRFMPGEDLSVLVLGCGDGWLERALAREPWVGHIDACDFAADAVARARALAPPRVSYRVLDLDRDPIAGRYDAIVAHSVLHHVENLEHAFAEIDAALAPGGTLIVNEYVGPNRFQFSDRVLDLINELLRALPPRLRRSTMRGDVYEAKVRPTVPEMVHNDPSEAARAEELLPLIRGCYDVLDERHLGGTLMQHLLYDIAACFELDDPQARSLLQMMLTFEGALVDEGLLASDFVLCAARRRGAPPFRERAVELPPLPAEAVDWRPSGAHWLRKLAGIARLAGDPRRPTLDPPPPEGEATWDAVLASAGGDPDVRRMLEALRRAYLRASASR